MKIILAFLIFGAVIAAGRATKCFICEEFGEGKDNCEGEIQECNEDETCVTQIEYNILGDNKQTVRKRCLANTESLACKRLITINTTEEFQVLLYTECCYTDRCNSGPIKMPPVDQMENRRECPTCFIRGSVECKEFGTRRCTGNQLQCLDFKGLAARPQEDYMLYGFKGCITAGACLFNLTTLAGSMVANNASYKCTTAKTI